MRAATIPLLMPLIAACGGSAAKTGLPPQPVANLCPSEGLCDAQGVDPIPDDLPAAEAREGGTWLPAPLDRAIADRYVEAMGLEAQNQVRIDAILYLAGSALENYRETCGAWAGGEVAKAVEQAGGGMPEWLVAVISGAALIVGGGIGMALGVVLGVR